MRLERPRAILALLTLLNFVNYVDRWLVAAVAPKFQEELHLTDFSVGLVNSAFMLGYFLTSPFFGLLGDRTRKSSDGTVRPIRTWLIALGVAVWSLSTAASGFAWSGATLIASRVMVGVGEAAYATLAPTIIDDIAPEGSKNKWLAIFYLATPVGSALGFMLGGFLEHRLGWRAAFFVAGGPGVLLALLVLFIREPSHAIVAQVDQVKQSARVMLAELRKRPLYVACVAGACAYTFALGGFAAWAPTFLYRVHKMPLDKADFGFGAVAVVAGILGTLVGGWIADRGLGKETPDDVRLRRYLKFCGITSALAVPAALATMLAPSSTVFFIAIFVAQLCLFAATSPTNAVTLGAVPHSLRATAMAVSIFCIHAFGDLVSPPLIGLIADRSASLRNAMYLLPIAIGVSAILWLRGATRPLVAPKPLIRG